MKKSLLSIAFLACAGLAVAAVAAVRDIERRAIDVATRAWRWVESFTLAVVATVASAAARHLPGPAVVLQAAGRYLVRQMKRQRPLVAARWRMCPSV
ncbi:MAG: hypothetical protein AB7P37_03190 [Ramlibacter sp.]